MFFCCYQLLKKKFTPNQKSSHYAKESYVDTQKFFVLKLSVLSTRCSQEFTGCEGTSLNDSTSMNLLLGNQTAFQRIPLFSAADLNNSLENK